MLDNNIKPELEVFDVGMVNFANYLIDKGVLKPPFYFNILLGDVASRADVAYLRRFIENPHDTEPGTTMPVVLATLSPDARANGAEAIAHYLASLAKSQLPSSIQCSRR